MQSRVTSSSLCSVKVNIMGERPLVAIGRKARDRICYRAQGAASRCSKQYIIQVGGGGTGGGIEGQVHVEV